MCRWAGFPCFSKRFLGGRQGEVAGLSQRVKDAPLLSLFGSHSTGPPPALAPLSLQAFLPSLLEGLCIEALLHGNLDAAEAAELARSVHAALGGAAVPADSRPAERCVQLPKGCRLLHR